MTVRSVLLVASMVMSVLAIIAAAGNGTSLGVSGVVWFSAAFLAFVADVFLGRLGVP